MDKNNSSTADAIMSLTHDNTLLHIYINQMALMIHLKQPIPIEAANDDSLNEVYRFICNYFSK